MRISSGIPIRLVFSALLVIATGLSGAETVLPGGRWAFQPLRRPTVPAVKQTGWARTPVDRFVLARLEAKGIAPSGEAPRRTLIRRISYDLIGLPPTPQEISAFLADRSPNAYEKLVDRLLASPHYGERWARHWLDLARYADSSGYETDTNRYNSYQYRDFVIRAFNEDLPYNTFLQWQLAGDEIAPNNPQALAATGFCTVGPVMVSSTKMPSEVLQYRADTLDDIVSTLGSAMLGLTVGCARCHNHKYDPIPTKDYYRLTANFTTSLLQEAPLGPKGPQALVLTDSKPTPVKSYLLRRGDPMNAGEEVTAGFLTALMPSDGDPSRWKPARPADAKTTFQRAALAGWICDPDAGAGRLAARVIVNRLWQHHFGEGIVGTPSDFGMMGDRPTHPDLLDWLAGELIHNGWRLKPIQRLIVTSAAYRQTSAFDPQRAKRDPENRLLWRQRPQRIEGEILRDAILSVSGCLNPQIYGPSIRPPIPADVISTRTSFPYQADGEDGPAQWRRSVYIFIKRETHYPMLDTFDGPNGINSCPRRVATTVPPQALYLLNDSFVRRRAIDFARRLQTAVGADARRQVDAAFELTLGRAPTPVEQRASLLFLRRQLAYRPKPAVAMPRGTENRNFIGPPTSTSKPPLPAAAPAFLGKWDFVGPPVLPPGPPDAATLALADFCQAMLGLNEFIYID